jgi:hypothetical protein
MRLFQQISATILIPLVGSVSAQTILHYQVSDTDAAMVASGIVPGVDGSEDGQVFAGTVTLSESIPTEGVPAGLANRSMSFNGAAGVNLPGTQQLLNSELEANGGFTYEAWFTYAGGEDINSIIDYAGTEKLVRQAAGSGAGYRNNSAEPLYELGPAEPVDPAEWHYAAVVFTPTSTVDGAGGITGIFTFYYDSNEPSQTVEGVTISNFGDSLVRTISVGAHPLGFGGDFYNGLIYEPVFPSEPWNHPSFFTAGKSRLSLLSSPIWNSRTHPMPSSGLRALGSTTGSSTQTISRPGMKPERSKQLKNRPPSFKHSLRTSRSSTEHQNCFIGSRFWNDSLSPGGPSGSRALYQGTDQDRDRRLIIASPPFLYSFPDLGA